MLAGVGSIAVNYFKDFWNFHNLIFQHAFINSNDKGELNSEPKQLKIPTCDALLWSI